jgi:hypothetical protein
MVYSDEDTLILARILGQECVLGVLNKAAKDKNLSLDLSPWGVKSMTGIVPEGELFTLEGNWNLHLPRFTGGLWSGTE